MRWMWIDRILELEPGERIVAIKNVSLAEEHLHDHFPAEAGRAAMPIMPASLIVEGVAQASGILVGTHSGFRDNVILAKVSRVELSRDAAPGDTLRYTARIDRADRQGAATGAIVELLRPGGAAAEPIGRVDLMFSIPEESMALNGGPRPPAGNFVFGESVRTLLRASGFDPDALRVR